MNHLHISSIAVVLGVVVGLLLILGHLSWLSALIIGVFVGVPAYLVSRVAYQTLRRPIQVGREALPGRRAVVVGQPSPREYYVRVEGELWRAESPDDLTVGERVYVIEVEDNSLIVCRLPPELL